jgi:hypothetical protein
MSERAFFDGLIIAWFILAAIVGVALFFVVAPYGRHAGGRRWGPAIDNRVGWLLMEWPAALVFPACLFFGVNVNLITALVFVGLWEAHYLHRAYIYPLMLRGEQKRMPLSIAGMGFFFNVVDGYLNGRYIFAFSGGYPTRWLVDPRFVAGLAVFVAGFVVNRHSDELLRRLRRPGESGYSIPHGGLYRWVSCPNYLGEIVEWFGWALATWSLPGLAFAVWTAANLAPRAWAHHRWYRRHFPDYPPQRKALLPGLW